MRGKKGQFYLLSAIIIVTIIVGFITVSNYSNKKGSVKIYDLKEELQIESQNIIKYGTYNSLDETAINVLLKQFVESYVDYAGAGKNLYFLFGDSESLTMKAYQEVAESISIDGQSMTITGGEGEKTHTPSGSQVIVMIEDVEYQFDLEAGENFYFIVSQEIEGEKYIVTG